MKIKSLQISNIWSFQYFENIENAPKLSFDRNFNILIGQNGAGKSTALEVINFIFKRVLFIPYTRNRDSYIGRSGLQAHQRKTIFAKTDGADNFRNFRLEKNYDFEDKPQQIRIVVEIDAVDRSNIQLLKGHSTKLSHLIGGYSNEREFQDGGVEDQYQIDITLDSVNKTCAISANEDMGFQYLTRYNLFKEVIDLYNEENPSQRIENLQETFALIGSYRNYSAYSSSVSIGGNSTAERQIQDHKLSESSKSTSAVENSEPTVFSLVRLQMARACYDLMDTELTKAQCESAANVLPFINAINDTIQLVNLKVEIKLIDKASWSFSFLFVDLKRGREITDINSLSAGQKAIVHLVFEAFGRGELKGGLVIIDEPEIHLHYQFQNEYLRIIEKLNAAQESQYILVTHSESLINSTTINDVIRFSLNPAGYTIVNQPIVTPDQRWLVKILDNQRSTHAFFGSKVLLVEGEDDAYFFSAALNFVENKLKKGVLQDISVLGTGGKKATAWQEFFDAFGIQTFRINDFDQVCSEIYGIPDETIDSIPILSSFISNHPDVKARIEDEYSKGIFILKEGNLEMYLGTSKKGLKHVIDFCQNELVNYLEDKSRSHVLEIRMILAKIIGGSVTVSDF